MKMAKCNKTERPDTKIIGLDCLAFREIENNKKEPRERLEKKNAQIVDALIWKFTIFTINLIKAQIAAAVLSQANISRNENLFKEDFRDMMWPNDQS